MTFNLSMRSNVHLGIEMSDFCREAKANKLNIAAIRAIDEIESAGSGFLTSSKRPKILFEGHYFYKLLARVGIAEKARKLQPTICYPTWTKAHYLGREGEYARIAKATEICHQFDLSDGLALRSASWGRYQIMGENFRDAGFDSVEDFVESIFVDEDNHLESFITYLKNAFLMDDLQKFPTNPAYFARIIASGYNGPGYRRNQYDSKMVAAFNRFLRQNIDCSKIVSGIHVVESMPGLRDANPAEVGVENTSLDDRYLDTSLPDPETVIPPDPSIPIPVAGDNIANLDDPGAVAGADPSAKPSTEAPNIAMSGSGDINQGGQATIDAANNLPDTVIEPRAQTGFIGKVTATIGAIFTGQYIIPDAIRDGLFNLNVANIIGKLFEGVYRFRYIIFGSLALWFIINQLRDYFLKSLTIKTNTDPLKGNVILQTPEQNPGIWASLMNRIKAKIKGE